MHLQSASSGWFPSWFWLAACPPLRFRSRAFWTRSSVPYRRPSARFTIVANKFSLHPAQIHVCVVSGISLSRSVSRLFKKAAQRRTSFFCAVRPVARVLTSEVLSVKFVSVTVAAFAIIQLVRNRRRYSVVQVQVNVASGHHQFSNFALSNPVRSPTPVIRSSLVPVMSDVRPAKRC